MKRLNLLLVIILSITTFIPSEAFVRAQTRLFNMSYIFFGSPSTFISQVNKTKGSLDMVSPNYFDIAENGELIETYRIDSDFINEMHRRGMKVVPFLANHWNVTAGKNGLDSRIRLAKDVAASIEKYRLDGVNVDIEGVNHTYRDAHTDFIRLLREYIPDHKEVSVAVAANPNSWNTGWHGFYDYKELSRHADYLMIMAYDESWESPSSPIGPVSSLSFFERSIQYAIKQGVPKDRIVAGLPFYGRIWKLDGPTTEGVTIAGKGLSSMRIDPLISKFNGKITFDEKTMSTNAKFTIPKGKSAFLGSTKLTEGNYVIWYDNEPAIRAKLRLPKEYGIKGTGSWALYHETPETWDYYTAALNWGDVKKKILHFGSGRIGVLTGTNVNFRENPSTNAAILSSLEKDTLFKITGESVTAENQQWYPSKLIDGTEGYIAENYVKSFYLNELYGESRYDTSILVSSEGWKEKTESVILGRGDLPIDALTGSVLATKFQSPLLLTRNNTLPENVVKEIRRLSPSTVYLLGGEMAISQDIESTLKQMGYVVERIAGNSRYETSVQVAKEVGLKNEMILTTGMDSPDALSVAPYAGIKQIPILLTKEESLPDEIRTFVREQGISKITIIGGEVAVSNQIVNELEKLGIKDIERISGGNRYDTSVAIATRFKSDLDLSSLYFASGISYIDALPGSPLAAKNNAPILLIGNGDLPASLSSFLQNELKATPNVSILGGYSVISDTTREKLFKTLK